MVIFRVDGKWRTVSGELFGVALELLRANPYGFLTTVDDGQPHTRLVQHVGVDDDGTVWIGTSPTSRKAAQISRHRVVSYAVEDRAAFAYACLNATAELVEDETERAARWQNGLEAFFPDGPAGDDFVLIRLRPHRVELMDFSREIHPDPYGLVPATEQESSWSSPGR
ncbi:pyridoxamine 5'-phosphate oxidase family protein [Actinomadura sp. CNU-125]|uniref:pyridoxamine 5'-phosphate oxidase family protein n=1 Tax=Actinomadura sp. CNU-125 TaxID=1904961 RepID=UPI0021CCB0DF|nr:pyridoxamine 5'-phosphate oxidase family protein [Actinomadura sp. CNU-125]